MDKKIAFSAIQPSGDLTIGNYLGALKNLAKLQEDYNCLYAVADLHSITVPKIPKELRKKTYEIFAMMLVSGVDPEKSVLFVQSHVPEHAMLGWILDTISYIGQLNRMTQYKDKSKKSPENCNAGLLTYPVLMAGDILLYQTDLVPVGEDQTQHMELARDLAIRFNSKYSDTFKVPEAYIAKTGKRIMSLQDPTKKMSKSDEDPNSFIYIMDSKDKIYSKIRRAVTDSEPNFAYDPKRAGLYNLINIYSSFTGISTDDIVKKYDSLGYKEFKEDLADIIYEDLKDFQYNFNEVIQDKEGLEKLMAQGRDKARYLANKTLRKVMKKVGFVQI